MVRMKETAYIFQAALVIAWWIGLAASETIFQAFQFEDFSAAAFWAFFLPDILWIALLSLVRAYFRNAVIEYLVLGGFAYATLYCINASWLTHSGYLATLLMVWGTIYNVFLCFGNRFFRPSRSSTGLNAIKTLIQIVCIWTLALVAIPYLILATWASFQLPEFGIQQIVGIVSFVFFSLLGLTSAYHIVRDGAGTPLPLDQTNRLVTSGPYRFVRNPMAVAGIGQAISIALYFQSTPLFIYALLGALVWHIAVRPLEEQDMMRRFGPSYEEYRRRVPCWIPSIRGRER